MEPPSIKKINLEQLQKPKTLLLIYYKNKRVSIPLFENQPNITEYLYHQIEKFEHTVLQPQQESLSIKPKSKLTPLNIVCFCSREQENNSVDLKMNILLSMMRLVHDYGKVRSDLKMLDITSYYKYMEIQPYYMPVQKHLISEYQLFTILSMDKVFTAYLGRRIHDGRFFYIQVASGYNKVAEKELNVLKLLKEEQSSLSFSQLGAIPQVEEIRHTDGLIICVLEFCPGGTLSEKSKKSSEMQCLDYMKQLIWGVHTLHQKFNILHRHLTLDSVHIDFHGNLRIYNYRHGQPCFSSSYLTSSEIPKSYEDFYQLEDGTTPPEVKRSGNYNRLVDYYGIGTILYQIYKGRKPSTEDKHGKIIQREGIQIAIENLMSQSLKDRELFTNEIISELIQEKRNFSMSQTIEENYDTLLSLNKLKTGKNFTLDDRPENNVFHEEVIRVLKPSHDDQIYYLHPVNKRKDQSKKKKSKSKSRERKGSQENSGNIKKSFDTKSKNSNISNNSSGKSITNKSISGKKTSVKQGKSISSNSKQKKVKPKPLKIKHEIEVHRPKIPMVKSPQNNHSIKSPGKYTKPKKQQGQEYVSYFNKIAYKHQ